MRVKRTLLAVTTASALGAASIVGLASAADSTNSNSLVDEVAQQFNLDKSQVQKVFDDHRGQLQSEREAKYEERLNQAVADGKLTEEQKTKILAKHQELREAMKSEMEEHKAMRQSLEAATDDERQAKKEEMRTKMEQRHAEIKQWEKDNNIPSGYLFGGGDKIMLRHGPGGAGVSL